MAAPRKESRRIGATSTDNRTHTELAQSTTLPLPVSSANAPAQAQRRPLRPIQDILDRLTWDIPSPSPSPSSPSPHPPPVHIIGYLDRHLGLLELPLPHWQRDTTAQNFIPLHRIRYVKLRQLSSSCSAAYARAFSRNFGIEGREDVERREGEVEAWGKIGELEERIKRTGNEVVKERLGEVLRALRLRVGSGGDRSGEREGKGVDGGEREGVEVKRGDGDEPGGGRTDDCDSDATNSQNENCYIDITIWDREQRIDLVFGSGVSADHAT